MSDIVEFLRARLEEDQRRAQGSGTVAWLTFRHEDGSMRYTTVASGDSHGDVWIVGGAEVTDYPSAQVIYDEQRVLAEVAAKRRVIDGYERWRSSPPWDGNGSDGEWTAIAWVLMVIALPYADHADYQDEWKQLTPVWQDGQP